MFHCFYMKLFDYDYTLDAGDKNFLEDIISDNVYERLFRTQNISFLNKGKCGNGGTTGFVRYALQHDKGCLILVPNRSIVMSKEEEYKDNTEVCCVYGGSGAFDRDTRIVIATYDQFPRLLETLTSGGYTQTEDIWKSHFWSGRTIIIDEYHKLVDDSGYRDICHRITELVRKTDSGAVLMSATPHMGYIDFIRDIVENRDVITYNIDYQDTPKLIQIYDVKKKDLKAVLKKVKDSPRNNHTCVFYNSISGIKKIIDQIGGDDCEILCSETNEKDLGQYYSKIFDENKRLHFLTSAYFTGHDIKVRIRQCIIIGSPETENMCLGERDIKQIIGRFRKGVDGISIFYMYKRANMDRYQVIKDDYDKKTQLLDMVGEKWKTQPITIQMKQETIRLEDILDRYDYWSKRDKLAKRLENYGYVVKNKKIGEFEDIEKRSKLTFKEAQRKIAVGEDICYDEYKYGFQLKAYMEEKGVEEMLKASRTAITDWYKIRKTIGLSNLEILTPEEKFKALGLENFGRYKGSYLMSCLEYLGESCDYDLLTITMREVLGCYSVIWKNDPKSKDAGNIYIVFITDCGTKRNIAQVPDENIHHYISYQTEIRDKNCYGRTISLKEAPYKYKSLNGIPLYDWVNGDKEHRLLSVKAGTDWKNIKNFRQTKISEMYKDTDKEYRHCKSSMEYVDCLIVDIDGGITFKDFQGRYKDYVWTAYPTINNITEDWTKFRVIVPLKERLQIKGEYNVMTLKMLRSMFCYYEDSNHQLPSYINSEDWAKRRGNSGELYDIPQEVVDDIMMCIKNSKDLKMMRFDRNQTDLNVKSLHNVKRTLLWAKECFKSSFEMGDGERHKRLFVIKNNLNDTDRDLFQSWLANDYPSYLSHWKSHKIVKP